MLTPRATRRRTLGIASAVAAPACAAWLFASCSKAQSLDVVLEDPAGIRAKAATLELLIYPNACPPLDALSGGVLGAPSHRALVAAADAPPPLGDLDRGTYGIAALLRDGACAVVGSGCVDVDLDVDGKAVIPLGAVKPPRGACGAGSSCVAAACVAGDGGAVDAGDGGDAGPDGGDAGPDGGDAGPDGGDAGPDGGSGACSLALVANGALPALAEKGGSVAGPSVIATPTGFLVAFREGSVDATTNSASVFAIADDGTAGKTSKQAIPTCPGFVADDGVGLAATAAGGLLAVTRPACADAGAGLTVLPFDKTFGLGAAVETGSLGTSVRLAPVHALEAASGTFEAALISQGVAYRATLDPKGTLVDAPLFAGGTSSFAEIAATSGAMATLADLIAAPTSETVLTIGLPTTLTGPDAGDGGGGDASAPPQTTFSLHAAASPWGSVAAWSLGSDARAAAVLLDPNGTSTYAATDAKGTSRGSGTLGQPDAGALTAADLAVLGDHLLIVVARARGYHLWKLAGAEGASLVTDGAGVDAINTVGDQNLGNYDGARVAIAAARKRVLVTWVTRKQLGSQDATGGFALYSCGE